MIAVRLGAPGAYDWRDTATSPLLGVGSTIAGGLVAGLVAASFVTAASFRICDFPVAWWSGVLCFVLDDLAHHAFHRSAHRVRWFWAAHSNHHSSQHYNLTTALRQTWTGFFALSFAFRLPLLLIGFPPALALSCGGINIVYQFWIHSEVVRRLPWGLERVLNTPSHHRVHNGNNPRYLDRNFAGASIVWDRLFDSFEPEDDAEPPRYGLVHNLVTWNLVAVAFHEWRGIARPCCRTNMARALSSGRRAARVVRRRQPRYRRGDPRALAGGARCRDGTSLIDTHFVAWGHRETGDGEDLQCSGHESDNVKGCDSQVGCIDDHKCEGGKAEGRQGC